jgi:hypothetical protein
MSPVMGLLLLLLVTGYLMGNLSRYLEAIPWWRCLENWLFYRVWTSCRHAEKTDVQTPVEMGGVATIYELLCANCGIVFLRDSFAQVTLTPVDYEQLDRATQRGLARAARHKQVWLWLCRWALSVLREGRRICTYLGGVVLTLLLLAWFWWTPVRRMAYETFVAACAVYVPVENRETQ